MKPSSILAMLALLIPGLSGAQGVTPLSSSKNLPLNSGISPEYSAETRALLQDQVQRDRAADVEAAMRIQSDTEARQFIDGVLAQADAAAVIADSKARARIRVEEAGRTDAVRLENIEFLRRRLRGEASLTDAPESFRSRLAPNAPATTTPVVRTTRPRFYDENRRVITFRSMTEVPPVLIASSRMNRVKIEQVSTSPYGTRIIPVERRPAEYVAPDAYAVTYAVDPNSEVARDDILFVQGSTAFQDAYSHDLVVDLAVAIADPALEGESFVVEGHASSEGNYDENLSLSQARAERIVREMVRYGVPSSRLIPVGYGENEAEYPSNADENLKATDRRVTLYRLK
jgi:outer membrane protein OmpA-like peptidoglycan-associated protein